jgi:mono/diheme cytochrome c family protein
MSLLGVIQMNRHNARNVGRRLRWGLKGVFLVAIALVMGIGMGAAAQDDKAPWVAPDDAKKVQNPVKATPEGLASAAHLYKLNCAGCHGVKGDGNGPAAAGLERKPANFTDAKFMAERTDGDLFWKISTGRPPMPTWQTLSETQRWELVNYLRTLAAKASPAVTGQ